MLVVFATGCSAGNGSNLKADKYIISAEEDALSEKWAEYLYNHLSKRSNDKSAVELRLGSFNEKSDKAVTRIHFEVNPGLRSDYLIENRNKLFHIRVREEQTAVWIIYQLIDNVGLVDNRFNTSDLHPAIINMGAAVGKFDFIYRDPHFSPNLEPEYAPILGTNNVESDWGIWGHNLVKINNQEKESAFALVNDKRRKEQICFSSEDVFEQTKEYIVDNFGSGEDGYRVRLMIMPADNELVCMCPDCIQAGNEPGYATPAVHNFINRLSEHFPNHYFFTSAYLTTKKPPKYQLPENSGVFFSTIDLPKGVALGDNKVTKEFLTHIEAWRNTTPNIYLWDYASNFDDYLTPLPTLLGMQAQFQFFKKQGIKGLFINGSGYDYTPFDDVKTFVMSALMMHVNVDVNQLVTSFFEKNYPESHSLLTNYYMDLENQYFEKNTPYNIYGGMRENINTYLDVAKFIEFYESLQKIIPTTKDEERQKLEKLFVALTYTRLQIAYTQGVNQFGFLNEEDGKLTVKPEIAKMLNQLKKSVDYPDLKNYKESDGNIVEYVAEWEKMIKSGSYENKLMGISLKLHTDPDEGFENIDLLNDGTFGFAQDYHQGWYIYSRDDLSISFPAENLRNAKHVKLRFLHMERHKIRQPNEIQLLIDGKQARGVQITKNQANNEIGSYTVDYLIPVNFSGAKNIELKIFRNTTPKSKSALDEIQILNN